MARESRDVWAKRVERWRDSGLSVKEFAREVGINANTLAGWRWRLRAEERAHPARESVAPGRRSSAEPEHPKAIEFVELVQPPDGEQRFEVVSATGWTVRVPARFDGQALKRLLNVLEGA